MNIEHDIAAAKVLGVDVYKPTAGGPVTTSLLFTKSGNVFTVDDPATRDAVEEVLNSNMISIRATDGGKGHAYYYERLDAWGVGYPTRAEAIGAACVEVVK